MTKLAGKYDISADECAIRQGAAAEVVAAETDRLSADVLIMGAVSRSLLTRPVIGNTAERVIDHVDCDVFIVKPTDFKARRRVLRPQSRQRKETRSWQPPAI